MKKIIQTLLSSAMILVMQSALAQKIDQERMERDIAVAENVLGTLIKQQFEKQKMFFSLEIKSNYQPGYGVTFYIPSDYTTPIVLTIEGADLWQERVQGPNVNYSFDFEEGDEDDRVNRPELAGKKETLRLKDRAKEKSKLDMDSVQDMYNNKVIEAAKTFLVDYGDMITQLAATERITISNQGDQPRVWVKKYFNSPSRTHLSIEVMKSDLVQYKQNKITRDQALAKIKVINTESVNEVEPDLELLSSIFTRLYRPDLSKTFFIQDNIYFERLKDYGVVYYMQALSAQELGYSRRYVMPTVGLEDVDQATRDKTVKELYPKFEGDLKDNILEYGRTLKSLKDEEVLVFQVKMTRCAGCKIPSSLEYTVKSGVLKDFNSGKINKNTALGKFEVKKGEEQ
ncbi:hypothetical protein [Chryseolinea sp. H1M3-3]|uniref:hypothetical protein n=1 Tax=Chryseolinea sp. H1M3-3 TaxID=3034144 RepID=UPI0023EB42A2|nr:hypothetical protein [Chryseolinea sp. H1M3-3]